MQEEGHQDALERNVIGLEKLTRTTTTSYLKSPVISYIIRTETPRLIILLISRRDTFRLHFSWICMQWGSSLHSPFNLVTNPLPHNRQQTRGPHHMSWAWVYEVCSLRTQFIHLQNTSEVRWASKQLSNYLQHKSISKVDGRQRLISKYRGWVDLLKLSRNSHFQLFFIFIFGF